MASALQQLEARVRQPARDVLAVAARREHVQLALPQPHLGVDVFRLEAPRLREREVVVRPAADALPHGLAERLAHDRAEPLAFGDFSVDLGQLRDDLFDDGVGVAPQLVGVRLDERLDRFAPFECRAELLDVDLGEVGEEVEVRRVGWRGRDESADSHDAIGQQRAARECVWCAAGAAHDGKALEPELVRDRRDVRRGVRNAAAGIRFGEAVPGPVVGDHPHAVPLVELRVGVAREPASRGAVVDEHRYAVGRAALDVGQRPSVRSLRGSLASHGRDHTTGSALRT